MPVGMIVRADQGGLAAQTWEMARHVPSWKLLVIDLGHRGRGVSRPERFQGLAPHVRVCHGNPPETDLAWLCDGVRSVYTAEGTYGDRLPYIAAMVGVRLVVHANPELWCERSRDATTRVVLPTHWETHRVPAATIMPVPVDRDRVEFSHRRHVRTFWHPGAPAMEDRNGTRLVLDALPHVEEGCTVILTGTGRTGHERIGRVNVEHRGEREHYWQGYADADAMLLPRRYGGLSLPVQEALSAGMPVVMLETGPYAGVPGVVTIPTTSHYDFPMKGGIFPVWDGSPMALAAAMDALVRDPDRVARLSDAADAHAATLDWAVWERPWRDLLESA